MKFSKKISVLAMCSLFFVVVAPFCAYAGLSECAQKVWDIDENGEALVEQEDLLMLVRYAFSFQGDSITNGAVGNNARKTPGIIRQHIEMLESDGILDIDGDGEFHAGSDCLLLIRYARGLRGSELTNDAVTPDAIRTTPEEIIAYIENIENYHLDIKPCAPRIFTDYAEIIWDIDDNGEALIIGQDALMILRYMVGFQNESITNGIIGANAGRTSAQIITYIEGLEQSGVLDIDGNGAVKAGSDGMLLMRYSLGFRGLELTDGAVGPNGSRTTPEEIIAYIEMGGLPDCTSIENLSLDPLAMATQSSDYGGNPDSDDARDGSRSSYNHTNRESQPWWQIDLGSLAYIEYINLYNRSSNPERLKNFKIFVSETPFKTPSGDDMTLENIENGNICSWTEFVPGVIDNNNPEDYNIGEYGRYVRIQLTGTNYLNITEVEIYGCK